MMRRSLCWLFLISMAFELVVGAAQSFETPPPRDPDTVGAIKAANALANAGNNADAAVAFERAWRLAAIHGDVYGENLARARAGAQYYLLDNYAAAEPELRESLPLLERYGPLSDLPRSYVFLGQIYSARKDYVAAIDVTKKALPLVSGRQEETTWERLAAYSESAERYDDAFDYGGKAVATAETLNDTLTKAQMLKLMGLARFEQGRLDEAERYCDEAISVAGDSASDRSVTIKGQALEEKSFIAEGKGLAERRLALLVALRQHWLAHGKALEAANTTRNLGLAYNEYGDFQQAEQMYRSAATAYLEGEGVYGNTAGKDAFERGRLKDLELLAVAYRGQERLAEAKKTLLECVNNSGPKLRYEEDAVCLEELGYLTVYRAGTANSTDISPKALEDAVDDIKKAVIFLDADPHYSQLGDNLSLVRAYGHLAIGLLVVGDRSAAGAYAKAFEKRLQAASTTGFESLSRLSAEYGQAAILYAAAGDDLASGRMLENGLKFARQDTDITAIITPLQQLAYINENTKDYAAAAKLYEKAVATHRAFLRQAGRVGPQALALAADLYRSYALVLSALGRTNDALEISEEIHDSAAQRLARSLAISGASAAFPPFDLAATRNSLKDDEALLSFVMTARGSGAFIVTQRGVEFEVLPADLQLEEIIGQIRIVDRPHDPRNLAAAHDLYRTVLAPIAKRLKPYRSIGIVPDGPLHRVNLALASQDDITVFGDDHAIYQGLSLSELTRVRKPPQKDWFRNALIGANAKPPASSHFLALRDADKEVEEIANKLGISPDFHLTPEDLVTHGPSASLIHIAAHGTVKQGHPESSAIFLAPDVSSNGTVQIETLSRLNLQRTELVVLSACDTTKSAIAGDDGAETLARAFFAAGARAVIATLHSVDDNVAAELMPVFYENVVNGKPKAEALQQAQKSYRNAHPNDLSWSEFVLTGNPS